MKIVTIVGARPQFIKAVPVSRALRPNHEEILVHTGQHYDSNMSSVFFEELGVPTPAVNLGIGSGPHGVQTGAMLASIEAVLEQERPDAVLVYGDTNSTLAGALAASKIHYPVAHVEAGLRSFNRAMPEEINRIVTDHIATWLFAPSSSAADRLREEGITDGVSVIGDVMYDALIHFRDRARAMSPRAGLPSLEPGGYYVCTIHRAENTDADGILPNILDGLSRLPATVVFPCHPRTARRMDELRIPVPSNVLVMEPLGYLEMIRLEENALCVLTDSGGVQKEAYYLGVPCVTLRNETEWRETVEVGWNVVAGTSPESIVQSVAAALDHPAEHPHLYGAGDAAERIALVFTEYERTGRVSCVESLVPSILA